MWRRFCGQCQRFVPKGRWMVAWSGSCRTRLPSQRPLRDKTRPETCPLNRVHSTFVLSTVYRSFPRIEEIPQVQQSVGTNRSRRRQDEDEDDRTAKRPSSPGAQLLSPFLIRQKLAAHRHFNPVSFGILHFLYVHREIDCAHDPVTKSLMNQLFKRLSVDQVNLVEPVH
jgi:hypothetical protein